MSKDIRKYKHHCCVFKNLEVECGSACNPSTLEAQGPIQVYIMRPCLKKTNKQTDKHNQKKARPRRLNDTEVAL